RGLTQHGQENEGGQTEQRIGFNSISIFWKLFEMVDNRANLLHPSRATGWDPGFHHGQLRLEMLGLEAAAGIATKRTYKQPLGFVMLDVIITLAATPAVGLTQLDPAVGSVDCPAKSFRIHEGLNHQDGVPVMLLPILAEPVQSESKNPGTEIGRAALGQQKETAIVGDQTAPSPQLFAGPTDPFIAMF